MSYIYVVVWYDLLVDMLFCGGLVVWLCCSVLIIVCALGVWVLYLSALVVWMLFAGNVCLRLGFWWCLIAA